MIEHSVVNILVDAQQQQAWPKAKVTALFTYLLCGRCLVTKDQTHDNLQ